MRRVGDEGPHTFGGDNPPHDELMNMLRPDSCPKPLHWRGRDEKGANVDHGRLMAILVRLPEDYEP